MKSKTNVVSMSAGLNEATCVTKSQFVCAVKHKQAAVGVKKKKKKRKLGKKKTGEKKQESSVLLPGSRGDKVHTSPLEEKPEEPLG